MRAGWVGVGRGVRVWVCRLSDTVSRTGDGRGVIVPTARLLDATFQNWTRTGGGITGSVLLPILPGHPIEPIRAAYEHILGTEEDWDRRTGSLQVAEVTIDAVGLKLVMSAADPSALNHLRQRVREAMLEWLRTDMPEALDSAGWGRRNTPPESAIMPSRTSGNANSAAADATITSAASASSKPPPIASPLTAAITGLSNAKNSVRPANPPGP